jgi:hypothetical protein
MVVRANTCVSISILKGCVSSVGQREPSMNVFVGSTFVNNEADGVSINSVQVSRCSSSNRTLHVVKGNYLANVAKLRPCTAHLRFADTISH